MIRNRGYEYREILGAAARGSLLIDYLVRRYRHSDRGAWRERIEAGRVRLDGRVAGARDRIRPGQELSWLRPGWDEPDAPRTFAVLLEDRDLLAVAKPAGLPTLPGGGFLENTLLAVVREHYPAASPLHRLGRWTSGLVLFARSREARSLLSEAFRERRVLKRYRALAVGSPVRAAFRIRVPIGPVPYAPLGSLHAATASGRRAVTDVRVVERRGDVFLAQVTIETGRPHQIRIHLAAAGHPLVGDPLYGPGGLPLPGSVALPGDPGYLLHAAELELEHPTLARRVVLRCAPPPRLRRST